MWAILLGAIGGITIMVIAYATNTVLPMDRFPFLKRVTVRLQWQMERDLHDLGPVVWNRESHTRIGCHDSCLRHAP